MKLAGNRGSLFSLRPRRFTPCFQGADDHFGMKFGIRPDRAGKPPPPLPCGWRCRRRFVGSLPRPALPKKGHRDGAGGRRGIRFGIGRRCLIQHATTMAEICGAVRGVVAVAGYAQCKPELHFGLRVVFLSRPETVSFLENPCPDSRRRIACRSRHCVRHKYA